MSPSCKTCLCYEPEKGVEMVEDWGTCLRLPPVVIVDAEGEVMSVFPIMNSDERCFEWRPKQ